MRALGLLFSALLLVAGPAGARSTWERARPLSAREQLLGEANQELQFARQLKGARDDRGAQVHALRAIERFEKAATLGPPDADIHYRAFVAAYLYVADHHPQKHLFVIKHVDLMRAADPLDPRDIDVTLDLCHALAKEAARLGGAEAAELYERVIREYASWFRRVDEADPQLGPALATNYANVAEIYMAVGRLDEAIDHYRASTEYRGAYPALAWYGLAVAADRDGRWQSAREAMIRALELDPSMGNLDLPTVYFVPEGDKHYYRALAYHVSGRPREAIAAYQAFLRDARDAQGVYRARAREHLRELGGHAP